MDDQLTTVVGDASPGNYPRPDLGTRLLLYKIVWLFSEVKITFRTASLLHTFGTESFGLVRVYLALCYCFPRKYM